MGKLSRHQAMQGDGLYLLLLSLSLLCLHVLSQSNEYNQNTVPCPGITDPEVLGYTSREDLQTDIDNERDRIVAGGEEFAIYQFILCPNTEFKMDEPLRPGIDGITISCGLPPNVDNNCLFSGGKVQVDVDTFAKTDHPVKIVTLQGITFDGFTEAAVAGDATKETIVYLLSTMFQNFDSTNIVKQSNSASNDPPYSVNAFLTEIVDGRTSSEAFLNEGGTLEITDMTVDGVTASSNDEGVSSESNAFIGATGDEAAVFITSLDGTSNGLSVKDSDMFRVINLNEGADAILNQVSISEMKEVNRVIRAAGRGTRLVIRKSSMSQIVNEPTSENKVWRGIEASDLAEVSIEIMDFDGNENFEHLIAAQSQGRITASGLTVANSVGATRVRPDGASSVIFSGGQSVVSVTDSTLDTVSDAAAAFYVFDKSDIQITRVCMKGLTTDSVAFVQDDSTMSVKKDNAVEDSETAICSDNTLRLAQERQGSDCADNLENQDCIQCIKLVDDITCAQIPLVEITLTPTQAPQSEARTSSPSIPLPTKLADSDIPSTVPTSAPSFTPTASTQSPTVTPTTTGPPSRSPSQHPSNVPTTAPSEVPSSVPTIPPTDIPTVSAQPTTIVSTLSPTRCRPRSPVSKGKGYPPVSKGKGYPPVSKGKGYAPVSKGKGYAPAKGKGSYSKGTTSKGSSSWNGWRERALPQNDETYVYHWVYVAHPEDDDDIPYCDEPTPSPGKGLWDRPGDWYPPVSKGDWYPPVSKGSPSVYPPIAWYPPVSKTKSGKDSKSAKEGKSKEGKSKKEKKRYLSGQADFDHDRQQSYLRA